MTYALLLDRSQNWAARPTEKENVRLLSPLADEGPLFVPDIREHTANIAEITIANDGKINAGWFRPLDGSLIYTRPATDGVLVFEPWRSRGPIAVGIRVADCGAVTLRYQDRVFGVLHAGWKGLIAGILQNASKRLKEAIGEAEFANVAFELSPMAVDGYEFGAADFRSLVAPYCKRAGLDPGGFFTEGTDRSKGELRLHDLIVASLQAEWAKNIRTERIDTLTAGNGWPSHRRYSQGDPSKEGRLFAWIRWEPLNS